MVKKSRPVKVEVVAARQFAGHGVCLPGAVIALSDPMSEERQREVYGEVIYREVVKKKEETGSPDDPDVGKKGASADSADGADEKEGEKKKEDQNAESAENAEGEKKVETGAGDGRRGGSMK